MEITKEQNGSELTIYIKGSLDTNTSPDFEKVLNDLDMDINRLILDLTELEYISSTGLRAIFNADQIFEDRNGLLIRHPNEEVYEIFDITGSTALLTIEK